MSTTTVAAPARLTDRELDTLVREHLPLVGHLVREMLGRVPAHVNRDDLTSAGLAALAAAAKSFDPSRGTPFGSFATVRIRGALLD
ncbi:sigma-70 family RNA polymerase sigma factor, partial [Cryptosporangium japonicum]|uniref:sigma-70 family RNA polymerase sigma factor n=1 Tax=Cryptosporangium japonicum TaxID=80872 RepID=UPI0031DD0B25